MTLISMPLMNTKPLYKFIWAENARASVSLKTIYSLKPYSRTNMCNN